MDHKEVVLNGVKWLKSINCSVVISELATTSSEIPDVIGFKFGKSILLEAKSSRTDFLKDKKKPFRLDRPGMGNYRFYICPEGIIKKEDLPFNWGLIYINNKGKNEVVVNPYCSNVNGNIWNSHFKEIDLISERNLLITYIRKNGSKRSI